MRDEPARDEKWTRVRPKLILRIMSKDEGGGSNGIEDLEVLKRFETFFRNVSKRVHIVNAVAITHLLKKNAFL